MNLRHVVLLLIACISIWSFSAALDAQQVQIKGPKNNTEELSGTTYGPIKPEDTLWRIASVYKQNKDLSVYQVMQAIYELNPEAFEDRNFNHIKDGSILKLPSQRYAQRIDAEQARIKAEQDDKNWQAFTSGKTESLQTPAPSTNVSKDDLTETKEIIEQKITDLDAEQNRQFMAIRQQFAESIEGVQSLLTENQKLIERLDTVDTEISSLRGRVDEELQVQMDQMLALQNELLAISKDAEMQRKAEMEKSSLAWLSDPLFLIFLTALLSISLIGGFAMWLIRRNKSPAMSNEMVIDDAQAAALEQSDEMDDLADALTSELSNELDDDVSDDDDLFGDDDLLDDVLSDELEESLDSALGEEFDDLDDDSLDPIIEEATEALDDDDGLLDQDDLDNLFDEDEDDLLAEIDDGLDDLDDVVTDELGSELLPDADDELEDLLDEGALDDLSEDTSISDEVDLSESDLDDALDTEQPEPSANIDEQLDALGESVVSIAPPNLDDEPDQPEISIDDLLEQPEAELPDSIITDNPDLMNEEMLQNVDKEIKSQNEQLDEITDDLLNEIEQLEQMGGMLKELDEDEETDVSSSLESEPQLDIQELDSLVEEISDADEALSDETDIANVDALLEQTSSDSVEPIADESEIDDILEQPELKPELEAATDDTELPSDEGLATQGDLSDESVETMSADELLAGLEIEAAEPEEEQGDENVLEIEPESAIPEVSDLEASVEDVIEQPTSETLEAGELTTNIEELDKALEEFEQEVDEESIDFEEDLPEPSSNDDAELDKLISHDGPEDIEQALSELEEGIPSIGDLDSLSESESDDFDDSDLDEALKAFDENLGAGDAESTDGALSESEEPATDVELEGLPGLGDWLSTEDADETASIDELENTSFDELLDSIDDVEEQPQGEESNKPSTEDLDDSGLDFDALLNESATETSDRSADNDSEDFLDIDDLISQSVDDEGTSDVEKELKLDAALESYDGISDAEPVDVDGDNGIGAKLDLAQAYIETDDVNSAKELLEEIIANGDETQKKEATELLASLS